MIAVLLLDDFDPVLLTRWSLWFCRAWEHDLCLIRVRRRPKAIRSQQPSESDAPAEIRDAISALAPEFQWADSPETDSRTSRRVEYVTIDSSEVIPAILSKLHELNPEIVVLPRKSDVKSTSPDFAVQRQLLSEISSTVALLCPGEKDDGHHIQHILVPVGEGNHSYNAISRAKQLAEIAGAKITGAYVEPDLGDDAKQIGERIINRIFKRSVGESGHAIESKVTVSNNLLDGLSQHIDDSVDIVVMGMQHHGVVHRFFFRSLTEELTLARLGPTVLVVRDELPLAGRLLRVCDRTVKSCVPQIEREARLSLVERIQSSSKWDFDFVALICLSTLIAGGGLIQNSSAVVIGAMLVAPLMTPLLGTGLALVQANLVLFRNTIATVARGFVLAFILGCFLGITVPGLELTSEMYARGSPGVFDLVVAFVSGVAAAYATGRPNLLSALPGVAIAASLVPPIATSGIAIASGNWELSLGAAALFFTNILAIVLGTAFSFWAVGIRGSHAHGHFERWSNRAFAILLLLAVSLGIYDGRTAAKLPRKLRSDVTSVVRSYWGRCESIRRDPKNRQSIIVQLTAAHPLGPQALNEVITVIRKKTGPETPVEIRTTLFWPPE